jgi:L-gulonolactone oxidase
MSAEHLTPVESWGRIRAVGHEIVVPWTVEAARAAIGTPGKPWLAHGLGRSYGDVAFNGGGRLLMTSKLDRFIAFDRETGVLEAEAGVTLEDAIRLVLPQGWFLPTTPGTKFVTLGGAVANDVHGKNHHSAGTFGSSVLALELARSDGSLRQLSLEHNADLFRASIGGLGLTGLITKVSFQLSKVPSAYLDTEEIAFSDLEEFFAIAAESDEKNWEHTVSWMDCVGRRAGRGIFARARWSPVGGYMVDRGGFRPTLPFDLPGFTLNSLSVKAFNTSLFHLKKLLAGTTRQHYDRAFYPLDGILQWNRLYGRRGFYQYQCVIPKTFQHPAMAALLREIGTSGQASFLAVAKVFGDKASPGYLSFPMPGTHLALDFPNSGPRVHSLFQRLDAIVAEAKGRIYPAKDARMPAALFRAGYPDWTKVAALKDPNVHSDFWSRVAE